MAQLAWSSISMTEPFTLAMVPPVSVALSTLSWKLILSELEIAQAHSSSLGSAHCSCASAWSRNRGAMRTVPEKCMLGAIECSASCGTNCHQAIVLTLGPDG